MRRLPLFRGEAGGAGPWARKSRFDWNSLCGCFYDAPKAEPGSTLVLRRLLLKMIEQ